MIKRNKNNNRWKTPLETVIGYKDCKGQYGRDKER